MFPFFLQTTSQPASQPTLPVSQSIFSTCVFPKYVPSYSCRGIESLFPSYTPRTQKCCFSEIYFIYNISVIHFRWLLEMSLLCMFVLYLLVVDADGGRKQTRRKKCMFLFFSLTVLLDGGVAVSEWNISFFVALFLFQSPFEFLPDV